MLFTVFCRRPVSPSTEWVLGTCNLLKMTLNSERHTDKGRGNGKDRDGWRGGEKDRDGLVNIYVLSSHK